METSKSIIFKNEVESNKRYSLIGVASNKVSKNLINIDRIGIATDYMTSALIVAYLFNYFDQIRRVLNYMHDFWIR